jgi:hypothetical protein
MPVTLTLDHRDGSWRIISYQQGNGPGTTPQSPPEETVSDTPATTATSSPSGIAITAIAPQSGPIGTNVTIAGTGFNSTSQIVLQNGAIHPQVTESGTVITFTVPESVGAYCTSGQACPMYALLLKPGNYALSVRNDDGAESNAVRFTLTATP